MNPIRPWFFEKTGKIFITKSGRNRNLGFPDFRIFPRNFQDFGREIEGVLYVVECQYIRRGTADRAGEARKDIHPGGGASFLAI